MNSMTFDADLCIMTKFFRMAGTKWKAIILHLIRADVNRFSMLQQCMPRISKKVLTEQLRELEKDQFITRTVLVSKAPKVVVYSLTEKGSSLRRLLDDMVLWSLQYLDDGMPEELLKKFRQHIPTGTEPGIRM
jgi:DNA-binding HxlR family transcriptional regulator